MVTSLTSATLFLKKWVAEIWEVGRSYRFFDFLGIRVVLEQHVTYVTGKEKIGATTYQNFKKIDEVIVGKFRVQSYPILLGRS